MRKITLSLLSLLMIFNLHAQDKPKNRIYWKSASEFIFSMGNVEARNLPLSDPFNGYQEIDVTPVLRFSGFFHFQEQLHIDFSEHVGMFTGLGVRNIGMINKLNDSVRVKQRVYSVGIPLALKIGKFPGGFFVAAGGEAELFFHYKQKVFHDDEKYKRSEWFSDKVNLFNPSVFLDISSNKGTYLRVKYYLLDFLTEDKQHIRKVNNDDYPFYPQKSQLFYIAIGTAIKHIPNRARRHAKPVVTPISL